MSETTRPMEILLVEDNLLQTRLTIETMKRGNFRHRLTAIPDGQEALDFLYRRGIFRQAPRPDLVLLDLRLPGMDGLDVLAEIKGDEEIGSIPVVIMTASDDEQDRLLCESHQVEAYMTKPVNLKKFLSVVHQLRHCWQEDLVLPQAVS
jgi:two-component system, chemotaxis family, response regulator Rcp1